MDSRYIFLCTQHRQTDSLTCTVNRLVSKMSLDIRSTVSIVHQRVVEYLWPPKARVAETPESDPRVSQTED